jgi:glycerate kinase
MRVLIAPDKFAGTLTAPEAAAAIATGWRRTAPGDTLVARPLSDGGTGFVDVLAATLDGELRLRTVPGPDGRPTPAVWLHAGTVGYVEAAQAAGTHLLDGPAPLTAGSAGVGELLADAVDAGARRVVLGVGGTACTDGGAGLVAALADRYGLPTPAALRAGGAALRELSRDAGAAEQAAAAVDALRALLAERGVTLVAATDVDNPLTGLRGAAAVYGPQKGASPDDVQVLDAALTAWLRAAERVPADAGRMRRLVADQPGAGAGGGIGYALLLLGATRVAGIGTVAELTGLDAAVADADLVISGEGSFDFQSLRGKVVSGVAAAAGRHGLPCVVLAGAVEIGRREMASIGVSAAYGVVDMTGSVTSATERPGERLADLAARVARTWSR